MQWRNRADSFGWTSILLHWLTVPLVIFLLACGVYMKTLDYYDPLYHQLPQWHKTFGMLLAAIIVVRLGWVVFSPPPAPLAEKRWQKWLAKGVHLGMYVMLVVISISGYLFTTADGKPMELLGYITIPNLLTVSEEGADRLGLVHQWTGYGLGVMVCLHALAAIFHHVIAHDNTLKRIIFPTRN